MLNSASPTTTASNQSLTQSLIRAFAGVGVTRVVQMVLSLLVSVLLARTLGPENFGSYTLVLAVVGLCALPAYAGLAPLLVREVARYDVDADDLRKRSLMAVLWSWSLRLTVLIACATGVAGGLFFAFRFMLVPSVGQTPALTTELTPLLLVLLVLCVVLVAVTRVGSALLQGLRRVVVATVPETVVRPVVLLLLLSLLFFAGSLNTTNALLCFAFACFCACCYLGILLRGTLARFREDAKPIDSTQEQTRWRKALGPFTGIAALGYLNTELFVPLVALFVDTSEVAYFKIAMSLALLVAMPLMLVEAVIKPQVTRLYEAGDGVRLRRLVNRSGWGALALSIPVLVLFGVFGAQIVEVVFGDEFIVATRPMLILAAGFAVVNLIGPSMQLLYATRFEKDALIISAISLPVVVLLSLAIIPSHGAIGAALVFALGKVFRAIAFRLWAAHRLSGLFSATPV